MKPKYLFAIKIKLLLFIFFTLPLMAYAKTIELDLAFIKGEKYEYYYELLQKSLEATGHQLIIRTKQELPQLRIAQWLKSGDISLHWFIQTTERDSHYTPIRVGITNDLVGQRVLFIRRGEQQVYDQVKNLDDFRNLKICAGFGTGWFDVKVWKHNRLDVKESGKLNNIFKMVENGDRHVDYITLGFNQALNFSGKAPYLDIEKRLLLIYERDFRFYLAKNLSHLQPLLENALQKAKDSGLIDHLIRKHWAESYETLNYDQRLKIHLVTPK